MKLLENLLLERNQKKLLKFISKKIYSVSSSEEVGESKPKEKFSMNDKEFIKTINSLDQSEDINMKILREIFDLQEN